MTATPTTLRERRFTVAVQWLCERPRAAIDLGTLSAVNRIVLSAQHPCPGSLRSTEGVIRLNQQIRDRLCPPEVGIMRTYATLAWLNQRIGDTGHPAFETAQEAMFLIAKAHPFVDGNGRTARALISWLLLADGYKLRGAPEAYCQQYKASCYAALADDQPAIGPLSPPTAWRHFFSGLVDNCFLSPGLRSPRLDASSGG